MSPCEKLIDLPHAEWGGDRLERHRGHAPAPASKRVEVLFLPELSFARRAARKRPCSRRRSSAARRTPASIRRPAGSAGRTRAETMRSSLRAFMRRFSDAAAALVNRLLPDYRATDRARPRQLSTGGNRGPRLVVAQGRHAPARRQFPGDAVRRPPHPARVHQREPGGPAARVASRRRLRMRSRDASRTRCRMPLPGVGHALALLRVTKTPALRRMTR